MKKIINSGTYNGKEVFCEIKFENDCLSIHGVISPRNSGNCYSCRQIKDYFLEIVPNKD